MDNSSPYIQLQQDYHKVVFGHQPVLFNLQVHHLPSQLNSCFLMNLADDHTLLKVIPTDKSTLCCVFLLLRIEDQVLLLKLMLIFVELLIEGEDGILNLNLQSLILFVYLLNVSIPLLGMMYLLESQGHCLY